MGPKNGYLYESLADVKMSLEVVNRKFADLKANKQCECFFHELVEIARHGLKSGWVDNEFPCFNEMILV